MWRRRGATLLAPSGQGALRFGRAQFFARALPGSPSLPRATLPRLCARGHGGYGGLRPHPLKGFHPLRIPKRAARGAFALPRPSPQAAGPCSWACRRLLPLPLLSERNEAPMPPSLGAWTRLRGAEGAGRRHCRPCPRTVYKTYAFPAKFNTILKQKINV